eukprot:6035985-Lingulodinium_polyedra.AAC.1
MSGNSWPRVCSMPVWSVLWAAMAWCKRCVGPWAMVRSILICVAGWCAVLKACGSTGFSGAFQ